MYNALEDIMEKLKSHQMENESPLECFNRILAERKHMHLILFDVLQEMKGMAQFREDWKDHLKRKKQ